MVKGHHLLLRCHLLLFHNCNFKAHVAHLYTVNGVDVLLTKGAIEPSPGGVGFLLM